MQIANGELKPQVVGVIAGSYSSGDMIGTLIPIDVSNKLDGNNSVLLMQLDVIDKESLGKKLKVFIFSGEVTPPDDNVAFDITTLAELMKLRDVEAIETWTDWTGGSIGVAKNLSLLIASGTERKFYLAVVAGEAITFAENNSLIITPSYYVN